jgi:Arc/MetJ family transcription regulator
LNNTSVFITAKLLSLLQPGKVLEMRLKIKIKKNLMKEAMHATGLKTEKETIECALESLVALKRQGETRALRGNIRWEGNLDEMRSD